MDQQQTLDLICNNISAIPDYPKPGILFRDITTLVAHPEAFQAAISWFAAKYTDKGITTVVGTEARGFIFGAPVALALGARFVPVRKPGKLPRAVFEESYELEYGVDVLQIHQDAIQSTDRVLIVDDLLATGGTVEATIRLVRRNGGQVTDAAFVIALTELGGIERVEQLGVQAQSIVHFSS